ncbi:MAG TPA: HPr family phosphocarrier protein [Polyangia bacterium]|nr:HPr family phosphocarrier protein [Polyangia bacterium]
MPTTQRDARVRNKLGLHARAAVTFVKMANKFVSEVKVAKDGTTTNGKSIMGLLTLVAGLGSTLTIICEGEDAEVATRSLGELVDQGFGEGVEA